MKDGPSSGLTSPDFAGRIRHQRRSSVYKRRSMDGIMPCGSIAASISRTITLPEQAATPSVTIPVRLTTIKSVTVPVTQSTVTPSSFDMVNPQPRQQFMRSQTRADQPQTFRQTVLENLEQSDYQEQTYYNEDTPEQAPL